MALKQILHLVAFMMIVVHLSSCQKFLDKKPDKSLVTPQTLQDLQAILDNDGLINSNYPAAGQIACDDYYLTDNDWLSLTSPENKDAYVWAPAVAIESYWQTTYQKVFSANTVLENIDKVHYASGEQATYEAVKGAAFFIRAYSFFTGAQVYTLPYKSASPGQPGMVLKLTADINEPVKRSTIKETYDQIIRDLKEAIPLLPLTSTPLTRPNRAAAFALMANTYLVLHDFQSAGAYADSSLAITSQLINYNTLSATAANPFTKFNAEVLFQARLYSALPLAPARCKIDSNLYTSYNTNDLRKSIFFKSNGNGTYAFKGSYDANSSGSNLFSGLAVDEMYLVKAETAARLGNVSAALTAVNDLLQKRWKTGFFTPLTAVSPEEALMKIIAERRKELALRGGVRWMDVRRLNTETAFAKTMRRVISGQLYELAPDDLRYAFLLPVSTIQLSGLQQNAR